MKNKISESLTAHKKTYTTAALKYQLTGNLTPLLVFSPTAERQEMEDSLNKLHILGISGELLVRTP